MKRENRYYIYVHKDFEGQVRYVGKGTKGRSHDFKKRSKPWLEVFADSPPTVEIVKKGLFEGEAYQYEMDLMVKLVDQGCNLANILRGHSLFDESKLDYVRKHLSKIRSGEKHWSYGKSRPLATRLKISETKQNNPDSIAKPWLGKKRDPEFMARITAASQTPEAIAKRADAMRGRKLSDEHKAKIGKAGMGRSVSQDTKDNISAAKKGRSNGLEGTKHSDERKAKQSAIMKERMKTDVKLREALKNRKSAKTTKKAKAVLCIELDKFFRCAKDAALELGCSDKHIQACCTGRRKTHHGYRWAYAT